MAIFFDAPVAPDDLTPFVREVPVNSEFTLQSLFPVEFKQDNRIDFSEIVRTNRTARYRSFDGRIHVSERDSGSTGWVGLVPLSSSLAMGEYERLQLEFARTSGTNRKRSRTPSTTTPRTSPARSMHAWSRRGVTCSPTAS